MAILSACLMCAALAANNATAPTSQGTSIPTAAPTSYPTSTPTIKVTMKSTTAPTTKKPTSAPTTKPTSAPTIKVTASQMKTVGDAVSSSSEKSADDASLNSTDIVVVQKMPVLPKAYSVVLEINREKQKDSKTVHQYFDFNKKRFRTDVHDNAKVVTVIRDIPRKTKYAMINDLTDDSFFHQMNLARDSFCVKEDDNDGNELLGSTNTHIAAAKTRHMKSPHEVFMFDSNGGEKYIGEDYARGVLCTQWYAAPAEETNIIDGHKITTKAKRNHWFSVPGWKSGNCGKDNKASAKVTGADGKTTNQECDSEIPIRTVSEGTVYNATSKTTVQFHDHYEYTAFVSGTPSPHLFTPETEEGGNVKCTKGATDIEKLSAFDYPTHVVNEKEDAEKDAFYANLFKEGMMPELPTAYTAVLEINRVKSKESMNVFEYFDFNSQRVRTDVLSGAKSASVIRDYNTRSMYTITDPNIHDDPYSGYNADDQCLKTQLQEEMRFASQTRHLKSPHEVFMFSSDKSEPYGSDGKETFIKFDYARGIKCSQWAASSLENQVIDGHFVTVFSKRNHWFSAPDWSDAGCVNSTCNLQVPVRVVSEGHILNQTNKRVTKFHDHYEYMGFVEGKPPTYMFAPSMNCGDVTRGSSEQELDNAQDLAGGGVIGGILDALEAKKMPSLPNAYSVVVEMNRVKQEETMTVSQYFDFGSKRVRTDVHDDNKIVSVVRDFNKKQKYILTNDLSDVSFFREMNAKDTLQCIKEPLTASASDYLGPKTTNELRKTVFAAKTRHMKSPHEVFMFDSNGDEKYIGEDYARGVKCTQWYAFSNETEMINGHKITTKAKRNHWFSAADWSDAGCTIGEGRDCFLELPIRTVSEGTIYNHATKVTTEFHDHYEYTAFTSTQPDEYIFVPDTDPSLTCKSAAEGSTTIPVTMRTTAPTVIVSATGTPQMPKMPEAYTAILEINKVNSLESQTVREYLDFVNQNIRTDVVDNGKMTSVVHDFKNGLLHKITDSDIFDDPYAGYDKDDTCVTSKLDEDYTMYTASRTRHLKSPHEVFMFSPEAKVSYVGVDYARGIKCNQWYADGTEDQTVDGHKLTITSKRNHWFSTQDWSDANCVEGMLDAEGNKWDCSTQIPVRIVSEGKIYNHTTKMTTSFHDHYEYIGVIVGKAPEYMFDATGVCTAAIAKKNFPEKALSSGSNSNNNNNNGNSNGKSLRSPGALGASDLISKASKKSAGGGSGTGAGVIVGSLFAVVIALAAVAFVVKKKGRRSNMALNGGGGSGGHRRFVDDDGLNNGRLTVPVVQSGMITSEGQGLNASNLAAV